MFVREIIDKNEWREQKEFLQSFEYGEFLKSNGRKILRLEIDKEGSTNQIQAVINKTKFNISFLYVPRAYVDKQNQKILFDWARKQGYTFVRTEFISEVGECEYKKVITKNRQPHYTWILDVEKNINELLAEMHPKTRYNIGLAQRKNVLIQQKKDLELFWNLNKITTQRNDYTTHPKDYLKKYLELDNVYQINALHNDTPLASAILLKYNDTFYYIFGASSNEKRNLMAPYLLHLAIIQKAKELDCKHYDFWGIAPPANKGSGKESCYHNYCWQADHELTGVSRFKAGFGGRLLEYPQAQEIILDPFKYKIFSLLKKIKKQQIVGHPK